MIALELDGQIAGMDRATGKAITGLAVLRQSITDILTTPIGSRIARRDYGSHLPDLLDQPMNGAGVQRLYAATALALARFEPRLVLTQINVERGQDQGQTIINLAGYPAAQDQARRTSIAFAIPLTKAA
jgi:uncharacterized protein